jgi:hypothetical protein
MSSSAGSSDAVPVVARRRVGRILAVTVPPLALAVLGLFHPVRVEDAPERWRDLHVVALFVFPLLGGAPWLVLRDRFPRIATGAAVLGYVFAAGYTALDVLAGIGAGALAVAGSGGRGVLYQEADALAMPGLLAYLVAAVAAGVLTLRERPALAVPGAVLVAAGAVSFLTSHIYPPRGVLTMLALAIGWALLAAATRRRQRRDAP